MKIVIILLTLFLFNGNAVPSQPRVIKGTIYSKEGKKASGVLVTAHKSNDKYYSSFDGRYQIRVRKKSKWLKFKFPDKEIKFPIEGINRDVINFGRDSVDLKN